MGTKFSLFFATVFGDPCWPEDRLQMFGTYMLASSLKPEAPPTLIYSHRLTCD